MAAKAYYIPNGPKNLQVLFPLIDFTQVAEYYLEIEDVTDMVIATTPMNQISPCDNYDEIFRIFFLTALGGIDAINFKLFNKDQETKSDTFEKPETYPLLKPDHAISRSNVKSNETFVVTTIDYGEEDMDWIDELFDSPVAWVQWTGTQGQPDSYIPIVITDKKREKFNYNNRYTYQITVEFSLSHDKFIIRN